MSFVYFRCTRVDLRESQGLRQLVLHFDKSECACKHGHVTGTHTHSVRCTFYLVSANNRSQKFYQGGPQRQERDTRPLVVTDDRYKVGMYFQDRFCIFSIPQIISVAEFHDGDKDYEICNLIATLG